MELGQCPKFRSLSADFSEALDCAILVRSLQVTDFTWFYDLADSVLFAIGIGFRKGLISNRTIDLARDFRSPGTAVLSFRVVNHSNKCPVKVRCCGR